VGPEVKVEGNSMDVNVNIDTQGGFVTGVQDSNWKDIDNPPAHVMEVASAVSKVTDGWTQLSVIEDSDIPYVLAFVPMKTVGVVSKEFYLAIDCYSHENIPVMMHLRIVPGPIPKPVMTYTMLPVGGEFVDVKGNIDRLVRRFSTLWDMQEAMTASIGNEEIVFFDGENIEKIKVYAKEDSPEVIIYQHNPKKEIINKVAEVFKGRTVHAGDDSVTVRFD